MARSISIIFILFQTLISAAQTNSVKQILQKVFDANEKVHSVKFTMYSEERLKDGAMAINNRRVKLTIKPRQIYFYSVDPNKGTEILWREGFNEDKMIVSPGSFPYVTFNLKYTSALARKDSHHLISDMGFNYAVEMIAYYLKNFGDKLYSYVTIADTIQWDNRSCIHIIIDYRDFAMKTYKVLSKENLVSIAGKFHLNDYFLLMLNPSIKDFDDVKEGQVINLPNFYCRKIEFYIDRATWLPVRQFIYDTKGIYEKYEFKSLIINPEFKPDEFTTGFKEYKF